MTAPLAEYTATRPYPCGHPRTAENTARRRKHRYDPWRETCLACERAQNAANYARRQPKRPRYICAMTPVQLAEAKAELARHFPDPAQRALDL